MKIKNIKELDGNSLSELADLLGRIIGMIEQDFLHVSDSLPDTYISGTNKMLKQVYKEQEKREEEEDRREEWYIKRSIFLNSIGIPCDRIDLLKEAAGVPEMDELPEDETYYIEYLNKDKRHARDRAEFKTYEEAKEWGRANFENFNTDMIRINQ